MRCWTRPCSRHSWRRPKRPGPTSPWAWRQRRRSRPATRTPSGPICAFVTAATPAPTCSSCARLRLARGSRSGRASNVERKQPWRLARAFGPTLLLTYLLRLCTLAQAMRWSRGVSAPAVAAIAIPIAEAAIDVDKPADLDLVETILTRREGAGHDRTADRHDQQPPERAQPQRHGPTSRPSCAAGAASSISASSRAWTSGRAGRPRGPRNAGC